VVFAIGRFAFTVGAAAGFLACGYTRPADVSSDALPPDVDGRPPNHYRYVLDNLRVPQTNAQSYQYGLDLDGDTTVDNQLGMVLSTFSGMGVSVQPEVTRYVDRGQILSLLDLAAYDLAASETAEAILLEGGAPTPTPCIDGGDTVCRRHLDGAASFAVIPSNAMPMPGALETGVFHGDGGRLTAYIGFPGGTGPISMQVLGARAQIATLSDSSVGLAVLAGGVSKVALDMQIIPSMRDSFMLAVMRDCMMLTSPPACGCASASDGKNYLGLFDTGVKDCDISISEVQNNSLIAVLFEPDITIEGQPCLSVGFGATAVRATFTP
jgi:hypothetical protein